MVQRLGFGIIGVASILAGYGVVSATTTRPQVSASDLRSVRALDRILAQGAPGDGQGPKTSYFLALRERVALRAFPRDTVDEEAYFKAVQRARLMPKAVLPSLASPAGMKPISLDDTPKGGGGTDSGGGKDSISKYWQFVGPKNLRVPYTTYYGPSNSSLSGRAGGLAYHPTDFNTIYMGAPAGGIWKTTDGGVNWKATGDGFASPFVGPIVVHPRKPNIVIAGLGDRDGGAGSGNGIMRSEDGGASWVNIPLRNGVSASEAFIDPGDLTVTCVAYAGGSGGIFRSTNDGYTFSVVTLGSSTFADVTDLSMSLPDSTGRRKYAAIVRNRGIYVSTDQGVTWTLYPEAEPAAQNNRNHIAWSKTNPNRLYYTNSGTRTIFQGDFAGGFTWTNITGNFPMGTSNYNWSQSWYDNHLHVAKHTKNGAPQDFLYVGLITVASWDGANWTDIGVTYTSSAKTHNDQHCMAVFPGDESRMIVGNDGGVWPVRYNSIASGTGTWTISPNSSSTLGISMFYTGAWHPTDETRMLGGTQDNASPVSTGDLANWINRTGGDGCGVAINPVNPLVQYGSAQQNGLYRTANGWSSQSSFGPGGGWGSDSLPFVTRMGIDPTSPNPLYVATNYLWRYNASGGTWESRLGATNLCPNGGTVLSIAVAPSNANTIYAGTGSGQLWRSGDKGATWRRLDNIMSPTLPTRAVTAIDVLPTNNNDILVTLGGGSGIPHLVRIADTSIATPIRSSVSGSGVTALPDFHASCVTRDDVNPATTWYVGNDIGVFMTTDGGATWSNATEPLGLPLCEVSAIQWVKNTGYLNVATYGRGMWRISIKENRTGDTTGIKVGITGSRKQGFYNIFARLINEGTVQANDVRITAATMTIKKGTAVLSTALPVRIGVIPSGGSAVGGLLFTGPNVSDQTGTVTVSGTFKSGTTNQVFSRKMDVIFP